MRIGRLWTASRVSPERWCPGSRMGSLIRSGAGFVNASCLICTVPHDESFKPGSDTSPVPRSSHHAIVLPVDMYIHMLCDCRTTDHNVNTFTASWSLCSLDPGILLEKFASMFGDLHWRETTMNARGSIEGTTARSNSHASASVSPCLFRPRVFEMRKA
jgi:hypothetical protein